MLDACQCNCPACSWSKAVWTILPLVKRETAQIRRYHVSLNDSDRKLVLAMVKKMAANAR